MRMRFRLLKSDILREKKDFRKLFERGIVADGKIIRCRFIIEDPVPRLSKHEAKIGFSIRGIVGSAVDRNRLKRLMRESYRLNKALLRDRLQQRLRSVSLVLLYPKSPQNSSRVVSFQEFNADIRHILECVNRKAQ